ncbi:MAG TPA: pseudouridine synthase [Verrucomicrobiae bacterium]|nr:pseudouridine synthase [Verrucomicrobiae bacterium]
MSRRAADTVIAQDRVTINGQVAELGDDVNGEAIVRLDDKPLRLPEQPLTIMLHKPVGFVCSRNGQGSSTIYDLLPPQYRELKPVGRLDKDSSGLLVLTNDGQLAHELTHPRYTKEKIYEIALDKPLVLKDKTHVEQGVQLEDGISALALAPRDTPSQQWHITMTEGRNRQIRRTFAALGYTVTRLHRTKFGPYDLGNLPPGESRRV